MNINAIGQGRPEMNISRNTGEEAIVVKTEAPINSAEKIKKQELTREELDKALEKLNTFLRDENTHAVYEIHDKLNDVMIKIVDDNTKEVILEIPPKKILDLVAKMCELVGVLVDEKA
ncbi:flagellar protein FlaG [Clostridium polynesiense]|uniref:flagellar protein FlaG n=1 Tax=Clostridium polynesiense TaxID=1325933 RepID=UPI00058DA6F3|nr:flagellar protein FlaG [Clostridium polynesiense]